ncbi:MAG: PPC domain-containing protein [Planctomycetota bacterium]|nr:PPC domain-containing protein [Planctomycetota bacterium]
MLRAINPPTPFPDRMFGTVVALTLGVFAGPVLVEASPDLRQIRPRGGGRGTEVVVDLTGTRLGAVQEVLYHEPGITTKALEQVNDKHVKATLTISPDCGLGPHALRIRTAVGLSQLCVFHVGALTEIAEPEPNGDRSKAPKIALETTVNGTIALEDVDYFAIDLAAGTRVNIEIEAVRLGGPLFDPRIALLDETGRELVFADDTCLVRQDAVVSFKPETAGTYTVEVRETAFGGGGNYHYRLHVGTFPRPLAVLPPGGRAGESVDVTWLGDTELGVESIKLPERADWPFALFAKTDAGTAPSAVPFRLTDFPNVMDAESNTTIAKSIEFSPPAALNGVIQKPGDTDWFRFEGKKDQTWDIRVWARRLRSPLDAVINVWPLSRTKPGEPFKLGKHLSGNDDNGGGPDSFVRVKLPADGQYGLRIRDHLNRGGPLFTYRVEVTPVQPRLTLGLYPADQPVRRSIPQGGRSAVLLSARRTDFGGPLKINVDDLPAGVTVQTPDMPGSTSLIPILLIAAADAPLAGSLANVTGRHSDPKRSIEGSLEQEVVTVYGQNKTVFATHRVTRLPVAVTNKAPFVVEIVQPGVPIVRNGNMRLKVRCTREGGFDQPIALRMLWNPPGIGSGNATIPKGASEAVLHLNANGRAGIDRWPIVVVGSAGVGGDTIEVSSQLASLEVTDAWVAFGLQRARVEIGKSTELKVSVVQKRAFEGPAKVELLGLPRNTKTQALEITKESAELVFAIETEASAPPGRHRGLFVRATILEGGEPIVHRAGGGQLMIDKPLPAKPAQEKKPKPKRRRRRRAKQDVAQATKTQAETVQ